jgi:hypothetical protein
MVCLDHLHRFALHPEDQAIWCDRCGARRQPAGHHEGRPILCCAACGRAAWGDVAPAAHPPSAWIPTRRSSI